MIERILIILLSFIFLGTFIARNLIVRSKTKQRIRASDPILATSILSANLCIFTAIFSTYSHGFYQHLGIIPFLRSPAISTLGFSLFAISIIMGWLVSAQMKESWRVGVHENQKTQLIQNGIYQYVRNPYFLSYYIMFVSLFLVRPSLVMVALVAISISIFHRMVLKEETHLLMNHGTQYEQYREITERYIPRFTKKQP
jgi:protein-S-isoprenylcysteine O-methyltransferase Ste14